MQPRRHARVTRDLYSFAFSLVLFCGMVLLLTLRGGGAIGDQAESSGTTSLAPFYLVNLLLMVFLGLNRGAAVVRSAHPRKALPRNALMLLLAQLLLLPYMTFLIHGTDGGVGRILLLSFYVLLTSTTWLLLGTLLALRRTSSSQSLLLNAAAVAAHLIPALGFHFAPPGLRLLSLVSPIAAISELSSGAAIHESLVAFLFVALVAAVSAFHVVRRLRRSEDV